MVFSLLTFAGTAKRAGGSLCQISLPRHLLQRRTGADYKAERSPDTGQCLVVAFVFDWRFTVKGSLSFCFQFLQHTGALIYLSADIPEALLILTAVVLKVLFFWAMMDTRDTSGALFFLVSVFCFFFFFQAFQVLQKKDLSITSLWVAFRLHIKFHTSFDSLLW